MTLDGLRLTAFTDAHEVGGAEISLANLLGALDPAIEVRVMGTHPEVIERVAAARPNTATIRTPDVRGVRDLGAILATRRAIAADRPDILHASLSSPWACRYAILAAATVPGVRTIAVEQLVLPLPTARVRRLKRASSRRLAAHIAVGAASARAVEADAGLPARSVRTIHNGVPDRAIPAPAPDAPHPASVTLARLDPVKGLDVLARSVAAIPDLHATVIGRGPEEGSLAREAAALGVADRFVLAGWQDDPRAALADADLFVLPSRAEGLPLSICEAMLAGLPVVATDVGSVREIVEDGVTGLLVPADDAAALTAAIRSLLDDPARRAAMGAAGRARAAAEFTVDAMAQRYEAIYVDVLAGRPVVEA
jgi:glycosyltransferase involved in cell wall biosynthesis